MSNNIAMESNEIVYMTKNKHCSGLKQQERFVDIKVCRLYIALYVHAFAILLRPDSTTAKFFSRNYFCEK